MSEIPTVQLAYGKPNKSKQYKKWIIILLTLCGIAAGGWTVWNQYGESIGRWYSTFRYNRAVGSLSSIATNFQNLPAGSPQRATALQEATGAWKKVRYWHLQVASAQYASEEQTPECNYICERASSDGQKWLALIAWGEREATVETIPIGDRDLTASRTNELDIQLPTSDSKMTFAGCDLDTADASQIIAQSTVDGATRALKLAIQAEGGVQCAGDGWSNEPMWWPGDNNCKLVEAKYKFIRAIDLPEKMYAVEFRGDDELAVASMNLVQIMDLNGKSKRSFPIEIPDKKESTSERLGISDSGKWIFTAAKGFPWRVYNVDSGSLALTGDKTEGNCWESFPDAQSLIVSNGKTTQTYDLLSAKLTKTRDQYTRLYAVTPQSLVTASGNEIEVEVVDRTSGEVKASMPMPANVYSGGLSPDGKFLVMTGTEGVNILDAVAKKLVLTHVRDRMWYEGGYVRWSNDSKFAVIASGPYLYIFRAEAPQTMTRMVFPMGLTGFNAAISPDNKTVIAIDRSAMRKLLVMDVSSVTAPK